MALAIKDGANANQTLKSTLDSGEHVVHHRVDNLPADPATATKQDTIIAALTLLLSYTDGLEGKDFATQTTLAAVLAKLIAAPATEAKQDTGNTSLGTIAAIDFATQTTLAAVLAKLIAAPATEAKQDTLIAKDFATQTTLAALLAKIIAAPATEAKQDALAALLTSIIKDEDSAHISGDKGLMLLGLRSDSDASTANDGDYTILKLDEEGRLKVASKPASYADVTGDITAIQATIATPVAGGTVIADVSRASNVMMFCTGTFSTVNVTFEGSLDAAGENWFGVQAVRSNANTIETATGNLSAAPAYAWELSVNALSRVRVRCTARTSGTQSWRFKLGTYATEPIPAAQISGTQPVSGTVTANEGTLTAPSASNINSAATTNATSVKASAGTVYAIFASNTNAAVRYLKFYNKASAPTVGTDVPVMVIPIPATGVVNIQMGKPGHRFATGIALAITTGMADGDSTGVAASEIKVSTSYI